MEAQDLDVTEKSIGSDIISRTETACTCSAKPATPDDVESGICNDSTMSDEMLNLCNIDHILNSCRAADKWLAAPDLIFYESSTCSSRLS